MRAKLFLYLAVGTLAGCWFATKAVSGKANPEVLQGWLSDEQCARGRAASGKFTATNPDCAHKCVREGKKIVFVDPVGKRVLTLVDQAEAKRNLGNLVEITGSADSAKGTLRADSIKFIDQARPMCEVPGEKSTVNP